MDNLVKIAIALLTSAGLIIFFYNEYKKCTLVKLKHDWKIYRKFNKILTDEHIIAIIKETQEGYLPEGTYGKVDTIVDFIQLPKNKFLDEKLNKTINDLTFDLHEIAQLYSMCGRCELQGNVYKLVAYKDGSPKEFELIEKSKACSSNLLGSYKVFRNKIKNKFKI